MSTRCLIVIFEDNTYYSAYCHFDGYPEGVGATLVGCYAENYSELKRIVKNGDFSSLEKDADTIEYYDDGRSEEKRVHKFYEDVKAAAESMDCEYIYIASLNERGNFILEIAKA